MTQTRKFIPAVATAALALTCALAQAAPVNFGISAVTFTPGAGYGEDTGSNSEQGGKLLDVAFSTPFSPLSFALGAAESIRTFDLGVVNFQEPNSGNGNGNLGIRTDETDDLEVNATFNFGLFARVVNGFGTATPGTIDDTDVDYSLSWTPLEVDFGDGGRFRLALNTLSFANVGTQPLTATVTLLTAPSELASEPPPAAAVPEPASLALAAIALAGAGLARRRRRG